MSQRNGSTINCYVDSQTNRRLVHKFGQLERQLQTGFYQSMLTGVRILHAHGANEASVGSSTML